MKKQLSNEERVQTIKTLLLEKSMTIMEIIAETGWSKSTAVRILNSGNFKRKKSTPYYLYSIKTIDERDIKFTNFELIKLFLSITEKRCLL